MSVDPTKLKKSEIDAIVSIMRDFRYGREERRWDDFALKTQENIQRKLLSEVVLDVAERDAHVRRIKDKFTRAFINAILIPNLSWGIKGTASVQEPIIQEILKAAQKAGHDSGSNHSKMILTPKARTDYKNEVYLAENFPTWTQFLSKSQCAMAMQSCSYSTYDHAMNIGLKFTIPMLSQVVEEVNGKKFNVVLCAQEPDALEYGVTRQCGVVIKINPLELLRYDKCAEDIFNYTKTLVIENRKKKKTGSLDFEFTPVFLPGHRILIHSDNTSLVMYLVNELLGMTVPPDVTVDYKVNIRQTLSSVKHVEKLENYDGILGPKVSWKLSLDPVRSGIASKRVAALFVTLGYDILGYSRDCCQRVRTIRIAAAASSERAVDDSPLAYARKQVSEAIARRREALANVPLNCASWETEPPIDPIHSLAHEHSVEFKGGNLIDFASGNLAQLIDFSRCWTNDIIKSCKHFGIRHSRIVAEHEWINEVMVDANVPQMYSNMLLDFILSSGPHIQPISHATIKTAGLVSCLNHDPRRGILKHSFIAGKYDVNSISGSIMTGQASKTNGISAIDIRTFTVNAKEKVVVELAASENVEPPVLPTVGIPESPFLADVVAA